MAIESDADRLAMLADFGGAVRWTVGAATAELVGLLHKGTVRMEMDEGPDILNARATLQCRTSDVPAGAAMGNGLVFTDPLTEADENYVVKSIEPDGTGMSIVLLEAA